MEKLAISIRNYNKENFHEIIDAIENAGFKNVFIEWYNDDLELQQNILEYVRYKGLNVIFAHLGYQNSNILWKEGIEGENETERYIKDIEICKDKGISLVIIHPTREYENPGLNEIGLKRIERIIKFAKEKDVKVAFENIELRGYLEYIIKNIKSDNLGICFDAGHSNLFWNGEFNTELFKNKVFAIHLHDNYKVIDDHYLPFDGTVDWNRVVRQIKDMEYNGYVCIESGYSHFYKDLTLEEYYIEAYKRGIKLIELLSK